MVVIAIDAMIAGVLRSRPAYPAVLREAATAAVFDQGPYIVLDLRRIDGDARGRGAPGE